LVKVFIRTTQLSVR